MAEKKSVEQDRRQHGRKRTDVGVEIYNLDPGKTSVSKQTQLVNISPGGMLVRSEDSVENGSSVLLKFTLPRNEESYEIVGRVIRCDELEGGGFEIALTFIDQEEQKLRDLESLI